jgi:hypothetical protein
MAQPKSEGTEERDALLAWLDQTCQRYVLEPVAVYRPGRRTVFPLTAIDEGSLQTQLSEGGHFLPLPKEPAALANVLEVSIFEFLEAELAKLAGIVTRRGDERSYPDIEVSGGAFGSRPHAIDIKAARRRIGSKGKVGKNTNSRITLYTGNTYFRHQSICWPGMLRPFEDYASHISLLAILTCPVFSDHG